MCFCEIMTGDFFSIACFSLRFPGVLLGPFGVALWGGRVRIAMLNSKKMMVSEEMRVGT